MKHVRVIKRICFFIAGMVSFSVMAAPPNSSSVLADDPAAERADVTLVIHSGFEPDTVYANRYLKGADHSVSGDASNWDRLNPKLDRCVFRTLITGTGDIDIIPDPENPENRAMKFEILSHNGLKGRAQGAFKFRAEEPVEVVCFIYRWYIPEEWRAIADIPEEHGWNDFFEIWSKKLPEAECDVFDKAGSFRVNFQFLENPDVEGQFGWEMRGENKSYDTAVGPARWRRYNWNAPVPFGQWSTINGFLVKGDDPETNPLSKARVFVRIKPDGGEWRTLFDVSDERTEHSHRPQSGYNSFAIFKNYTQAKNVDYLLSQGKRIYFLYDDVRLRVGRLP
ncbi:hypothetical protein [Pontiella sulfatireligans]|uniref:Carbohydrate-binding domain-containing protein n=1 Tax=Pontiella sulfatireligans TaxID=2750658 RepID=A0A6C2UKV0_9BACT|nr:hypothetical protein [Pontiella sulfatireligans]VGO20865.1 hypothetical protein SCARR_02932 [Pontiella sulfatireligans]